MLRAMTAKDHLGADPVAIALRGRLSLVAKDTVDALDNFETAVTAQPKLMDEAWFPAAIIQTYAANKPARTGALVSRLARPPALEALQRACSDLQYRVRHGAMDALKGMSASCSDPVSVLVLDAYQADKCDAARSVITDLLPHAATDDRVAAALDALSRRPPVAKCVADLIPHK
jgi:hypothetical protein